MVGMMQKVQLLPIVLVAVSFRVDFSWAFPPVQLATRTLLNARPTTAPLVASPHDNIDEIDLLDVSRRRWLLSAWSSLLVLGSRPPPAHAGLVQFPCDSLNNRYHFLRAGESLLEADNIYSTNPLFLTNRENSMRASARRSIVEACAKMKESGHFPTVAYHSLAANGMDTGDLIANELKLGRDRLLPEFTYLDQRGIGLWDSTRYDTTKKAIAALDYFEASREGMGGRPPPNEDGTPNETLADQFVRLRQFLSLQESRTSGENILIIFPDGIGPALLSCMIAGIPLNQCHCLDYQPGEIRLDITRESVLKMYQERQDDPGYWAMLEEGKVELADIREKSTSGQLFVSLKDQLADEKDMEVEANFLKQKQKARELEEQKRVLVQQRQQELMRLKQHEQEAKIERDQLKQEQRREKELQRKQELAEASNKEKSTGNGLDSFTTFAALGITAAGVGLAFIGESLNADSSTTSDDSMAPIAQAVVSETTDTASTLRAESAAITTEMVHSENMTEIVNGSSDNDDSLDGEMTEPSVVDEELKTLETAQERFNADLLDENKDRVNGDSKESSIKDELKVLEAVQKRFHADLMNTERANGDSSKAETAKIRDPELEDDGSDDWLRLMAEIRDEDDDI